MIGALVAGITGSGGATLSSYESIATTTVSGGTSYTFSSIPSTFKHLQIRYNLIMGAGADGIYLQSNSDTGSNYASHGFWGTGSVASATGYANQTKIYVYGFGAGVITTYPNVGIVDILDYASTSKYKTVRTLTGADKNASGGNISVGSGLWMNTNAITSITFYSASTFDSGTISLYGIKEA